MGRRKRGNPVHGVVLLDKPAGISSNQALQKVRRVFNAQKAGHTGTLDPFATGMLPICLGEATKTISFMLEAGKSYRATARLGHATDTGDLDGQLVNSLPVPDLTKDVIETVMQEFSGAIEQVPPMYSALKHQGKRLYELAREGLEVERKARTVTIHDIRLVDWNSPELEFEVHCSKGTYIRTLAEDIAGRLGSCAHLQALRRLSVEPFDGCPMVALELLENDGDAGQFLLPVDAGLPEWPEISLEADPARAFLNGNPVLNTQSQAPPEVAWVRVKGPRGELLGLAESDPQGWIRPRRVMHYGGAGAA